MASSSTANQNVSNARKRKNDPRHRDAPILRARAEGKVTADTRFAPRGSVRGAKLMPNLNGAVAVPRSLRASPFDPELLRPLQLMLAGGATDFEIADALGVHKDTLYDWKRQSPELAAMMLASK